MQNLLTVYDSKVDSFFPSSALNSTVALNSFVHGLPPFSDTSPMADENANLESLCNVSSADDCVGRLPSDPRAQIIVIGDFLSRMGQLEALEQDCVAKVAPVLLSESSSLDNINKRCGSNLFRKTELIYYGSSEYLVLPESKQEVGPQILLPEMIFYFREPNRNWLEFGILTIFMSPME